MYVCTCMYVCMTAPPSLPPCVGVWIRHCINEGGIGIQDNRVVCGYGNVNGQVIKCKSVLYVDSHCMFCICYYHHQPTAFSLLLVIIQF